MKKLTFLFLLFIGISTFAQVTTSKIEGNVTDKDGALFGATVVAKHLPTGTISGAMTQENGNFSIPHLRVGGPYTVTFSFIGYKTVEFTDIYLELGKTTNVDAKMASESEQLEEVVIQFKRDNTFNSGRTGAETSVNSREISTMPSISRSQFDFIRMDPSSSSGSFGGRNDQYNNFSLNGTIFNNPFGLDAATPGGQTDAQPISIDAIEQIHVATAPYDVTLSGFTGASVNAVTKSGTNEFKGSVFGYYRNQNMTGGKIKGDKIFVPELNHYQTGFSIGGPIIKDKLFFFANAERENRIDAGSDWIPDNGDGTKSINESTVLESDMKKVQAALKSFGYETGAYSGFTFLTESWKGIVKLDYNVNKNHRLALIYNFLDASREKPAHPTALGFRGPGPTILQFENSGYQINNKINSYLAELNSNFGNGFANKFQAGFTHFDDFRNPKSVAAPSITIQNGQGANYIIAGHEPFSIHNTLDQKVFQVNNTLSFIKNKHNFTAGFAFEKFLFGNSFNLGVLGAAGVFFPSYGSMQAFNDDVAKGQNSDLYKQLQDAKNGAASFNAKGEGVTGGWNYYKINVGQGSLFGQDEISFNDRFKLTLGLRLDKPFYFNSSELAKEFIATQCCYVPDIAYEDPETKKPYKFDSSQMPNAGIVFSPRIGFNWDVKGNSSLQVRGGSGIFTGRFPFVWIGNQNGAPNWWFYEVIDPDFQWPKVWKSSLGVDHKLGNDMVLSFDLSYADDIKAAHVQNWGLKAPTGKLKGVDNRPVYGGNDHLQHNFGAFSAPVNAFVLTNSDKGHQFNISGKIQKTFSNGIYTSLAYNFMQSKDVNSIEAEITGDAFAFNPAFGNVNDDVLSYSKYGDKHRVIGMVSKKITYGKLYTSIAAIAEYAQGARYNYTYGGDINGDGQILNDLIYIPTDDQINQMDFNTNFGTVASQRAALKDFINQDDYLSQNKGKYMERYGAISPFRGRWDVKIIQGLNLGGNRSVELSIDILNIGNMINSNWGVVQQAANLQPIGVGFDSTGNPVYSFNSNTKNTFANDASLNSRWQLQAGLRLNF
jgi:hypothetical protein